MIMILCQESNPYLTRCQESEIANQEEQNFGRMAMLLGQTIGERVIMNGMLTCKLLLNPIILG